MAGPFCKSCRHFHQGPFSTTEGECTDPSKIIYARSGNPINREPVVHEGYECSNHITDPDRQQNDE